MCAFKQSETDQARIAEALIASLDVPTDREVELAWRTEIDKRLHEIDNGTVKCVPWEEVRDRLYRNANVQR
ncbi:addiction module protein [Desulfonatronum lacustre]|uniref:addiction module protein n=1 Tax=Desulfonatronum lacustre TaxID=66849 RepID=UPI000554C20C